MFDRGESDEPVEESLIIKPKYHCEKVATEDINYIDLLYKWINYVNQFALRKLHLHIAIDTSSHVITVRIEGVCFLHSVNWLTYVSRNVIDGDTIIFDYLLNKDVFTCDNIRDAVLIYAKHSYSYDTCFVGHGSRVLIEGVKDGICYIENFREYVKRTENI